MNNKNISNKSLNNINIENDKKDENTTNIESKQTFSYTYSAEQQEEINAIRGKYLPKQETKLDQLRRLDQSTTRRGSILSMTIGVVGALLLGIGMCCVLEWAGVWFALGVVIGVIGIVFIAVAYPLYLRVTAKEREKVAPQILQLAEELSEAQE